MKRKEKRKEKKENDYSRAKSANDIAECDECESFSKGEKIKNLKYCDDRLFENYVKLFLIFFFKFPSLT